jgi:hypothetical protein
MKLYRKIPRKLRPNKRLAEKLKWGGILELGNVIHNCSGFNAIITDITIETKAYKNGWYIEDFDIMFGDAGCSLIHCCSKPRTVAQIEDYFRSFDTEEGIQFIKEWEWEDRFFPLLEKLRKGERICDDQGVDLHVF